MAGPGFSAVCGDANADADIVAAVAALGMEVVLEPASRVIVGGTQKKSAAFMAGLHAERLFWRSLSGRSIAPAVLLHAVEVVRHTMATAPLGSLPSRGISNSR